MINYILFYDSGVGGITTLAETIKLSPNQHYLYFADNINCPYGNKTEEEIKEIVCSNIYKIMKKFDIKLIVFACNTITACAISFLRQKLKVEIVGIEPAVKPALSYTNNENVLVISTKATAEKKRKSCGKNVFYLGFKNLAEQIENHFIFNDELNLSWYISMIQYYLKKYDCRAIILGCTHYSLIGDYLSQKLNITVFDGNFGVANRVKSVLGNSKEKGSVKFIFISTKDAIKMSGLLFKLLKK